MDLIRRLNPQFKDVGQQVKILRSEQGGEFVNQELQAFCADERIQTQYTNAYSPQENAIVERANGVVLPRVRAMFQATQLPPRLWGEALLYLVDTLNVRMTKSLGVSPFEALHGIKPELKSLRTWGCLAFVRSPPNTRQHKEKLQPRAQECLLGYSQDTKGCRMLTMQTGTVMTCRLKNARFDDGYMVDISYGLKLLAHKPSSCSDGAGVRIPVVPLLSTIQGYVVPATDKQSPVTSMLLEEFEAPTVEVTKPAAADKRRRTTKDDVSLPEAVIKRVRFEE